MTRAACEAMNYRRALGVGVGQALAEVCMCLLLNLVGSGAQYEVDVWMDVIKLSWIDS